MAANLVAWQCYELRKVVGIVDGQLQSVPIGYEWFKVNEEPPLYEPDESGRMFSLPPKVLEKPVFTTGDKPKLDLLKVCHANGDSS